MPNRTAGDFFNNNLGTFEIDMGEAGTYVEYSGFLATNSDAGQTSDTAEFKDFDGGSENVAGTPGGGSISGNTWVTTGAAELYKVMDAARIAGTNFAYRRTVTKGANSIIHTYSGCYCTQLGAGDMDANGTGVLIAPITISYSDRVTT